MCLMGKKDCGGLGSGRGRVRPSWWEGHLVYELCKLMELLRKRLDCMEI